MRASYFGKPYGGQGLVCNLDGLPFDVGSECFAPMDVEQMVNLTKRYLWNVEKVDFMSRYYSTNVVPVYCFMLGIDEDGNKCISRYRRIDPYRNTKSEVEWFRGSWVEPNLWSNEVAMSSYFDAITYSSLPDGPLLYQSWFAREPYVYAQRNLESVLSAWRTSRGIELDLFRDVDINQVFMAGTFTDGNERQSNSPFWGGLVILMVLPVARTGGTNAVVLTPATMTKTMIHDMKFIPKEELSFLDEVEHVEDFTCPFMHSFLAGIMEIENPYF